VTTRNGADRALALTEIEHEFPAWRAFRGINGLSYATLKGSDPVITVRGEDTTDLRDSIMRETYRQAELEFQRTGQWPDAVSHQTSLPGS
jgi:hypothetical protein